MRKVQILLATVFACVGTAATAQQDFSGPQFARWGETVEERQANIQASNFLSEAYKNRDYDGALVQLRFLVKNRPQASVNTFKYGANIYRTKINMAQTRDEKYAYVDSLLMLYDLRAEYFGDPASERASILGEKAKALLLYRSNDREGIRRAFREAIAANEAQPDPEIVAIYYKNLCDDYHNDEIYAEEVIAEYERLLPVFENNPDAEENRKQFESAFMLSGAANCENLERIFSTKLAANPNDSTALSQAVRLMSISKCNSPFFLETAEKFYEVSPSAESALLLAQIFQEEEDYDRAIKYLNEALGVTESAADREALLVRLGVVSMVGNRMSQAATAARQALNMNPENGLAYFVLAQAYSSAAAGCSGFSAQAVYWAAYDAMTQALSYMSEEDSYFQAAKTSQSAFRSRFPSSEECFFNELKEGERYTVNCGVASGVVTTVRYR